MKLRTRMALGVVLTVVCMVLAGCGTLRETLPGRSATEQLLISVAADRAMDQLPGEPWAGQAVFIDLANLEAYDKPYVIQVIRDRVLQGGGRLAADAAGATRVLQVASGALSIDKCDYLFGIPAIPLPIPTAGQTVQFPEVPFVKVATMRGKAKMLFDVVDPKTNAKVAGVEVPMCYGRSKFTALWVLFTGPYTWGDTK